MPNTSSGETRTSSTHDDTVTAPPLRVLIGADTFAPDVNGAAKFAERLAAGLAERGHDVHVAAPSASRRHGTWPERHEGQILTVHRLKSWRWYPHDWLRFALPWQIRRNAARLLDEVQPDVVHVQSFIVVGRGLSREAEKRGIRVILTNHVMPENMLEFTLLPKTMQRKAVEIFWRTARPILDIAEAVTTPTQKAADFLEDSAEVSHVRAISCGIDAAVYRSDFTSPRTNRILFVGRITSEKHIDVLVRAMTLLPESLGATLEIIGGGDQKKKLEALTAQLGLSDRVTFTGYVTDQELRNAYTRSTVLAMPSIAELQSIVTMEAMASGLPVVGANAMALPHLIHDGENGYLFEPGNADDLAHKLRAVLESDDDDFTRMKRQSLEIVSAHDIQRTLSTFESLYRGSAAHRDSRSA